MGELIGGKGPKLGFKMDAERYENREKAFYHGVSAVRRIAKEGDTAEAAEIAKKLGEWYTGEAPDDA